MQRYISYRRVSTQKQGTSGLGLEAQEFALQSFTKATDGKIIKCYTEIESGKRADRPELLKAIAHARNAKAVLLIAKLDRLARNVAFLSTLMESNVEFKACDNPTADKFTCHILAAVAEKEARDISARTKAALAAYKARGGKLGGSRPECRFSSATMARGQKLASIARQNKAKEAYASLVPMMAELRKSGLTLRAIAAHLNAEGYTSRRGKPFNHVQVKLVLDRMP